MCHQHKTLAKNCNGQLTYCNDCNIYHLTFNNIYIEFTYNEIKKFKAFLKSVKIEYWESKYDKIVMSKKITIQTMQQNLSLIFNKQEFNALKNLIFQLTKKPNQRLNLLDIDYLFFLN